jgi:hypothetical protein
MTYCEKCAELLRERSLLQAQMRCVQQELREAEERLTRMGEENTALAIALSEEMTARKRCQKALEEKR